METASNSDREIACLSRKDLAAFSAGMLASPLLETVANHVSGCPRCEATLRELDEDRDTILSRLRQSFANEPFLSEPECAQLETYAKAIPLHVSSDGCPVAPQRPKPNLDGANDLPAAARLGPYEILERLGKGGVGVVYKARQRNLNRLVALKRLLSGAYASPEERARFHIEATDLARLRHPNIVQIYESGEEDNCPYFSMELVEGGNLARRLNGVPLPARASAELLEILARAIHYAHEQGIVHRDLKPANILLASVVRSPWSVAGDYGLIPKITDFGLAKQLDAELRTYQTQTGEIIGTPSYMAPEQATGKNERIGPGTDVYGLGAILYEMLTGRPPFRGTTGADILHQVRFHEVTAPNRFQPRVPRDLETICMKCLQKEPQKRYLSALLLAEELRRFLRGEPIWARPIGRGERLWSWCRRNPALAAASALAATFLVVAALVSTVFAVYQAHTADRLSRALAEAQERQQQLIETSTRSARSALVQGLWLWEHGEPDQGLLWFALSLENASQAQARDLERVIRLNVAAARRQIHPLRACLAHEGDVLAIAFSPDGKIVLTGSSDGKAQRWDAQSGAPIGEPLVHQEPVHTVAFSPDGQTIVTGSGDIERKTGTLSLWQTRAPTPMRSSLLCEGRVYGAAFSPDGRSILIADLHPTSGAAQVRLWNVATGSVQTICHPREPVKAVAFSPDGETILISVSQTAQLWNLRTGQRMGPSFKHGNSVVAVAFSPNGKLVLTGSSDKTARLWEADTGQLIGRPYQHPEAVSAVAFSPDGRAILTGCADHMARLWQTSTGEPIGAPLRHRGKVLAVAISADGKAMATGGEDKTSRLWEITSWKPLYRSLKHAGSVQAAAFAPDGRTAITGSSNGTAHLWETGTGTMIGEPLRHEHAVFALAFSPDGKRILTGSWDTTACIWDATTGKRIHELKGHEGLVRSVAFSPDGQVALTASADASVRLWNVATGEPIGRPLYHPDSVSSAAFSPDGRMMVTGCVDHTARLYEVPSGNLIRSLVGHTREIKFVTFSPDGTEVLTGSFDNTAQLWDTATGQPKGSPLAHPDTVWAGTFSLDGKIVATASSDGTALLWNARTGEPFRPTMRHPARILAITFSHSGQVLLTGSKDGTARLWDVATGEPIGPSFLHKGPVWAAAFSPDDGTILTGSQDGTARLWEAQVPAALEAPPEQVLLWTQLISGMELDPNGQTSVMDSKTWLECRQSLAEKGGRLEP
ncbi:MAG TPA: protein kinase [Gemmataceae bacterium]|nr:protein kinase [Gemmataceae bacterium]